jgi:predicted amidohydrolase YtcJ
LPEAVVTPGFVDSHTHFTSWALGQDEVRLAGSATLAEAIERVVSGRPFQDWVLGQGWDANRWDRPPRRQDLDHVPHPVFLDSLDVHAAWVNSAALLAAGITRETPDPPGGRIVRDGNGLPTGLLLENAVALVRDVLPSPPDALLLEATRQAQREAHRLGVTGIHNVEGHHAFETFRAMDSGGELRLRVLFHHPVADLEKLVRQGTRSGTGSDWLTHGGVKMFLDGSLGSRTAWMLEPYEGTTDRGMPVTDREVAALAITTAANAGLAAVVHAIGDAAVRRHWTSSAESPGWGSATASNISNAYTRPTWLGRRGNRSSSRCSPPISSLISPWPTGTGCPRGRSLRLPEPAGPGLTARLRERYAGGVH